MKIQRVIEFLELCQAEGLEFDQALRLAACAFAGGE